MYIHTYVLRKTAQAVHTLIHTYIVRAWLFFTYCMWENFGVGKIGEFGE